MAIKGFGAPKKSYTFENKEVKSKKNTLALAGMAIAIIIIVIVAVILLQKPSDGKSALNVYLPNATIEESSNNTCDDICWLNEGVTKKSAYACGKINDSAKAQECFEKVAIYSLEACMKITDSTKNKECIIANAISQQSIILCDSFKNESEKNECIDKADPCYFKNGTEHSLCVAMSKNNYTYCGKDENCILNFVENTKDINACSAIKVEAKQYACMAIAKGKDSCKNLEQPSQRDLCFETYSMWKNQSFLCDEITYNSMYALECYQYFAVIEKNMDYCKKLAFNNEWSCYLNYSVGTNDVSGCIEINKNAEFSKVKCFTDFAMINRNPGACALMSDPGDAIQCYYSSIFMPDVGPIPKENCANITSNTWKDKCYSYSATGNNEIITCSLVEDNSAMQNCYDKFK